MPERQTTAAAGVRARSAWLPIALVALCTAGCAPDGREIKVDSPELSAYVQLIMPMRIEIQPHWTKPVSSAGNGEADRFEVILAAYDSFGDLTKIVGTLHFELYTHRKASSDPYGQRIAFWAVELKSKESLTRRWDPLMRRYFFPLQLDRSPLPSGEYILVARLQAPESQRVDDEYEFSYETGTAAAARVSP